MAMEHDGYFGSDFKISNRNTNPKNLKQIGASAMKPQKIYNSIDDLRAGLNTMSIVSIDSPISISSKESNKYGLDLDEVKSISDRANTVQSPKERLFGIILKLNEEIGELATAINIPEKCEEDYTGELADSIVVLIDLYLTLKAVENVGSSVALSDLNSRISEKIKKWDAHVTRLELIKAQESIIADKQSGVRERLMKLHLNRMELDNL